MPIVDHYDTVTDRSVNQLADLAAAGRHDPPLWDFPSFFRLATFAVTPRDHTNIHYIEGRVNFESPP